MGNEKSMFNINGELYPLHDANAVKFDRAQSLTSSEKRQARNNIGVEEAIESEIENKIYNGLNIAVPGYALDAYQARYLVPYQVGPFTISNLPLTRFDSGITNDMIVVAAQFGTPSAVTWPWHFNTSDGAITISVESNAPSGNTGISGSTTLTLFLERTV